METNLYFSVLVLTTCALHLGSTASVWLSAWWDKNVSSPKQPAARSAASDGLLPRRPAPQRSDWYAFFHCADLVGKESASNGPPAVNHDRPAASQKSGQLRRTSAYSR
jgi:hypothetical protein